MIIAKIYPRSEWTLLVVAQDGRSGIFDVRPYLRDEAFEPLRDPKAFAQIFNGGYFVEWDCGADLSADTIEARWQVMSEATVQTLA